MNADRRRPAFACLATTATVAAVVAAGRANGCTVEGSVRDGHVTMKDGDVAVYRALQKGAGGPWIVAGYASDRISWGG
jgi:hypothetical protein